MKQLDNRTLLIILILLAVAFVATRLFRTPAREGNIDAAFTEIDTASIDQIIVQPAIENHRTISFQKEEKGWSVKHDKIDARANIALVNNMLTRLASLKPERVVTRKPEKWDDYHVADSTSTSVSILSDGEAIADLKVGKENMGVTYLREASDETVFAMTGSFSSTFNQKFNDFRDQSFVKLNEDSIQKVTFDYPADSGFVLTKTADQWMIGNQKTDSARTQTFLGNLTHKTIDDFADDFSGEKQPDAVVTLHMGTNSFKIRAWKQSFAAWILASDEQPNVYFLDKGNLISEKVLRGKRWFLKE